MLEYCEPNFHLTFTWWCCIYHDLDTQMCAEVCPYSGDHEGAELVSVGLNGNAFMNQGL